MATRNIEMNIKTSSGYDVLYPNIPLSAVTNWRNSIYNKTEVDNKINAINNNLDENYNPIGWNLVRNININRSFAGKENPNRPGYVLGQDTYTITLMQANSYYYYEEIYCELNNLRMSGKMGDMSPGYGTLTISLNGGAFFNNNGLEAKVNLNSNFSIGPFNNLRTFFNSPAGYCYSRRISGENSWDVDINNSNLADSPFPNLTNSESEIINFVLTLPENGYRTNQVDAYSNATYTGTLSLYKRTTPLYKDLP